jgi:predicted DCC family thiol-disulfide oxidoreductase YuxK
MFGKAKCKLCDKEVRFVIRHLKKEHLQEFQKLTNLNMSKIMKKYFIE